MLKELLTRYPALKECREDIEKAVDMVTKCYKSGGKLLLCGNGGSCADCDHITGELMKGFLKKRALSEQQKDVMKRRYPQITDDYLNKLQGALPAIALPSFTALNAAFCNDVDPELIYAQSLIGLGNENDVLMCISTSGNSKNVYAAAVVGKSLGLTVIGLTGKSGGKIGEIADICIQVPETETFKIQEYHLPVYHYICAAVEDIFFKG